MNKFNNYILIIIIIFFSTKSYAQNIVYANLDIIIKDSNVGKKIIIYFDEEKKKLIDQIKKEEKILKEKEKSLVSQKNILQEDEYLKLVENLKIEINEFNISNQNKSKKINVENDQVTKSFLNEINKILKQFAETNNIDIILSSNQMLIGKSKLDVTQELMKMVNEKINKFEIKK